MVRQERARIMKAQQAVLGKTTFPPDKEMDRADRARAKREEARAGLKEKRVYATRPFKKALSHIAKARNILEPVARDRETIWRADVSLAMDTLPKLDSVASKLKSAIRSQ